MYSANGSEAGSDIQRANGTRAGEGARSHWRTRLLRIAPWIMALAFTAAATLLLNAKHSAFNTRVYDFARFAQAIWNTLHGRFLFETITYGSVLANHFSPIMALASPGVAIFRSERVLFLIQALNAAATGLILYRTFAECAPGRPLVHLGLLAAFYLNPALHSVTLFEVRRIVFGMPFLALALYGLATHRRGWMLIGFLVALLSKESVSLYVIMAGLYLVLRERDWLWGAGLFALGLAWLLVVSFYVIPQFSVSSGHAFVYPQLYYFSHLGQNYWEIATALAKAPFRIVRELVGPSQLGALLRLLLPLGLLLPFLAPDWLMICVPFVGLMFLSSDVDMIHLDKWYPATILPVLFCALGVGWRRIPSRRQRWAMGWLHISVVLGYMLFSPAPLGGRYEAAAYEVTAHDAVALKLLDAVPAEARVAAQVPYVPHLVRRADIYHYPWIRIGEEAIDVFVLDRFAPAYPFNEAGICGEITNKVADPSLVVAAEADGAYVLSRIHPQWPAYELGATAEGTMYLDRAEVALADRDGIYRTVSGSPIALAPGDRLRISLYWEALAAPKAERTVSVRVVDAGGSLAAQHDGLPADASKPTSWWEPGWQLRDMHYMTISPDAVSGMGSLDVLLYDSATIETVPLHAPDATASGGLRIAAVNIR